MPRLKADITLLIREKGKLKSNKLEIFKHDNELVRAKYNSKWYKKKLKFKKDNLKNLIFNTLNKEFLKK